ncbi:hypothetical protein KEM54_004049 [Ascosphaera aggregata]|nr:hypothetical protein KEM54_004049 [Ascosphaera aggregata]
MCCSPDCLLAFLAVLFPPVAVWVKVGICSADSFINIALCCLGYIPGLVHAWYIIFKYPEDLEDPNYQPIIQDDPSGAHARGGRGRVISRNVEDGRVLYYHIEPPNAHHSGRHHAHTPHHASYHSHHPHHQQGYQQPQPLYPDPRIPPHEGGIIPQEQRTYGTVNTQIADNDAVAGSSYNAANSRHEQDRQPPTYAEAVKGDHKIQHE